MSISSVMSVASFSVVLAESFAAVGLSTLIPAGFVTLARYIHQAALLPPGDPGRPAAIVDLNLDELIRALGDGLSSTATAIANTLGDLSSEHTLADTAHDVAADVADAAVDIGTLSAVGEGPKVLSYPPRPQDAAARLLTVLAKSTDHIDLLVPKRATIDANFQFSGAERYSSELSTGGMIEVVSVKGGYSALFEAKSSNEIKLHVEFELASAPLD